MLGLCMPRINCHVMVWTNLHGVWCLLRTYGVLLYGGGGGGGVDNVLEMGVKRVGGGRGRHEAQAPSNQVKNYKQIWHWVPNEVVSRSVWSISSVYWPAPLLGHRPSWSSACLFKVSMSRIIEQVGIIHIFRAKRNKSALWLSSSE